MRSYAAVDCCVSASMYAFDATMSARSLMYNNNNNNNGYF